MSQSPIASRTFLPKGEDILCPATVKQSLLSLVHPLAGPALVSPDVATTRAPASLVIEVPALSSRSDESQQQVIEKLNLAMTEAPVFPGVKILAPRSELKPKAAAGGPPPSLPQIGSAPTIGRGGVRLNKFVRRLHDMLVAEKDSGVVEWRRGLLVLHSTDAFAKTILPKYFNTRNFKTFRRQLNYYGFVHVRSFSTTGSTTTALWVNRDLAKRGSTEISSVLMLKRVEPCEAAKTAEGRRVRKEEAIFTVEEDIGVSPKSLQMEQIRTLAMRAGVDDIIKDVSLLPRPLQPTGGAPPVPTEVHCHHTAAFPLLSIKRQVSSSDHSKVSRSLSLSLSQVSSDTNSDCRIQDHTESSDSEDNVSAANLLLMLSHGGGSCCPNPDYSRSAISPAGHFLM